MGADAKLKALQKGMHTAGIFSDMSVDGPEIGTLVLVVDRARNLPNRKTIGKQDPYCAARLGKEAQKTKTDIRGGQTPKWDQELRFAVHDSPDYYQLKVSVFNDDKKTDLIGECWVDLRDIIVPGGGQNDMWQQLSCRGKYAGDIRIEFTYYDKRPKPEKPAAKSKQSAALCDVVSSASPGLSGSAAGPRVMPKRRPLPSDPVTGEAPALPDLASGAVHPSSTAAPALAPASAPALSAGSTAVLDHVQTQTPVRSQPNPSAGYVPNQSPLQQLEYNTPPAAHYQQPDHLYSPEPSSAGHGSSAFHAEPPVQTWYKAPERAERYPGHSADWAYSSSYQQPPLAHGNLQARASFDTFQRPQLDKRSGEAPLLLADDRPPPPPVHRSRNNSGSTYHNSDYELVPAKGTPLPMRHDVLRHEAQRHSVSTGEGGFYPGRPQYKAYEVTPAATQLTEYSHGSSDAHRTAPRHHSHDASYGPSHRSMQPSVEDVPDSPTEFSNSFRKSWSQVPPRFEPDQELVASTPPLDLGERSHAACTSSSHRYASPSISNPHMRESARSYEPRAVVHQDHRRSYERPPMLSYAHRGSHTKSFLTFPGNEASPASAGYAAAAHPHVPTSLIPGLVGLRTANELLDQLDDERHHRRRYTQPMTETPSRGRTMTEIPRARYDVDVSPARYGAPPPPTSRNNGSPGAHNSGGPATPSGGSGRDLLPDARPAVYHTIQRKSVSPAPPRPTDSPRLSGMPFGPDSYDALNPVVASAALDLVATCNDFDQSTGKIITHDGREVDPSDHLPMETWAPEPEPKQPKQNPAGMPTNLARPSPGGAQPLPPSGRRQLRVTVRPQSVARPTSYGYNSHSNGSNPSDLEYREKVQSSRAGASPPVSTGRNRLQKKARGQQRSSAVPMMSGANGPGPSPAASHASRSSGNSPSPLRALPPQQANGRNFTPPRPSASMGSLPRLTCDASHACDYRNTEPDREWENRQTHSPMAPLPRGPAHHGGEWYGRGHGAPAIPAKVPLALPAPPVDGGYEMSSALQLLSHGHGGHDRDPWANRGSAGPEMSLMEEMQRIDLGPTGGRSRRHEYGLPVQGGGYY